MLRPRPTPRSLGGALLAVSLLALLATPACGDGDGSSAATTGSTGANSHDLTGPGTSSTGADASGTTGPSDPTTTAATSSGTSTTTGEATATSSGAPLTGDTGDATDTSSTGAPDSTSTTTDGTGSTDGTTGDLPAGEFRVLQLNLCHSGVAGCFTGDAVMTRAVAVITAVAPALVTLNEVCRDDVPWLAAQTGALAFEFTPALKADDTPVKCKNGDHYGIGLLSWIAPVWDGPLTGVYTAQSSMTERRVWLCMGYDGFVGCTTHLSTHGETAMAQCLDLVGGPLATAAKTGPAVLGGDWNLKYNGTPNAQACVPPGFFRKGDGSVQHILASDHFGFLETIKHNMDGTTDHPGLEVRLTLP